MDWSGGAGDGVYGLGGVSMSTKSAHEAIYLDANAAQFELFYYQQPGGGTLQIYDNGAPLEQISTDGEPGPAYYRLEAIPGLHRVEAETLDRGPVRLFGWVAENTTGVTYEDAGDQRRGGVHRPGMERRNAAVQYRTPESRADRPGLRDQ